MGRVVRALQREMQRQLIRGAQRLDTNNRLAQMGVYQGHRACTKLGRPFRGLQSATANCRGSFWPLAGEIKESAILLASRNHSLAAIQPQAQYVRTYVQFVGVGGRQKWHNRFNSCSQASSGRLRQCPPSLFQYPGLASFSSHGERVPVVELPNDSAPCTALFVRAACR